MFGIVLSMLLLSAVRADDSVNDYLRATLENLKGQMTTGIPDLKIPVLDPVSIPTIDETVNEKAATLKIKVDNFQIKGLSKFETQMIDADLQNLRLSLSLFIPRVVGDANYDLDGKIYSFIPLYGKGGANVQLMDLTASGTAALTITGDGHLQLNDFALDVGFGSVFVNLENILGGGALGNVVNGIINMLGKTLFDKFRPDIKRELSKVLLLEINKALSKVSLADIQGGLIPSGYTLSKDVVSYEAGNANAFLDNMLVNARPTIEAELDPVELPSGEVGFSKKIIFVTVHGQAKIYDGYLAGLKTIHRTGDAEMSNTADGQIVVNAHLGLSNLVGHYRVSAKFMNLGPVSGVTVLISSLSVRVGVKQSFVPGSHPALLDFALENVGEIKCKFDTGFGPLDWILGLVNNFVIGLAKDAILKVVNEPLRAVIADQLNKITIPIGK